MGLLINYRGRGGLATPRSIKGRIFPEDSKRTEWGQKTRHWAREGPKKPNRPKVADDQGEKERCFGEKNKKEKTT